MRSVEIRRTFLSYFEKLDHLVVPSSSLVPDDPSLLLTTAGMVQFKPYFLGESPPAPRLASLQKCVRTVDIDNVGRTDRHATMFEMLGNFSFGDYDKPDVMPWAFDLLTEGFGLDPDRLWPTVYFDDDETVELWRQIGFPDERIQRLGAEDNFWSTGGPGPGGPCTELFYDRGPRYGTEGGPAVDTDRYLEIWNLVFMQHLIGSDGEIVGDLPVRCVESGLGVDRLAMVLQGVDNVHETDLTAPTLEACGDRVIADHVRAGVFLIGDGVLPSNKGRGYVLRRLLRRTVHRGRRVGRPVDRRPGGRLGGGGPFLSEVASTVIDNLGEQWPELITHQSHIVGTLDNEEEVFDRTLQRGTRLLDAAISDTRETLPAETVFRLYDTFGFPLDVSVEIAREAGLSVDTDRVAELMEEQRQRSQRPRQQ